MAASRHDHTDPARPRTLVEKIWDQHLVAQEPGAPAVLYVDLHLVHEVTSPQAFEGLRLTGRAVRRPELTLATMDHNVPTTDRRLPIADVFLTADIRTVSLFLKMAYINQGLDGNGYFTTPYYTGLPRRFQFGLRWQFFD